MQQYESKIALFWQTRTDNEICEALSQFVSRTYGFDKDKLPDIENVFLRRIHASIHAYNFLIDDGWEEFSRSVWNTPDFFEAVGYFNQRMREKLEHWIKYFDPLESQEFGDSVQIYASETESVLRFKMFAAIRLHQREFDSILEELDKLIVENTNRRDKIVIERWKADFEAAR